MYVPNSYHSEIFTPEQLKNTVDRVACRLREMKDDLNFDAIVVRGVSGMGMAFPVSYATGIPVVVVRKGESTHGASVEGPGPSYPIHRYLILDDFVDSGATIREIAGAFERFAINQSQDVECVGIFLYGRSACQNEVTLWNGKTLIAEIL